MLGRGDYDHRYIQHHDLIFNTTTTSSSIYIYMYILTMAQKLIKDLMDHKGSQSKIQGLFKDFQVTFLQISIKKNVFSLHFII